MRDAGPGPAASRYAVSAPTACTSRNCSVESAPVMWPVVHVAPPSTERAHVARCPLAHTTLSCSIVVATLTAWSSAVVPPCCSVIVYASCSGIGGSGARLQAEAAIAAEIRKQAILTYRSPCRGGGH